MSTSERRDFFQSVRGLALALTLIALLAFVLPSVLAARLQRGRVSRAEAQVHSVAALLLKADLPKVMRTLQDQDIELLTGPGDSIIESTDRRWISVRQAPLQSYLALPVDAITPDPWLRALQINIGTHHGHTVWVLSAGPNGIIDTPFDGTAPVPAGDDVAAALP